MRYVIRQGKTFLIDPKRPDLAISWGRVADETVWATSDWIVAHLVQNFLDLIHDYQVTVEELEEFADDIDTPLLPAKREAAA